MEPFVPPMIPFLAFKFQVQLRGRQRLSGGLFFESVLKVAVLEPQLLREIKVPPDFLVFQPLNFDRGVSNQSGEPIDRKDGGRIKGL